MPSTIAAAGNGNWSATATWTGGVVPGNGDTAALGTATVTADIATIPAAGTLAAITTGTGGHLVIPLATLHNTTINCTSIISSSTTGAVTQATSAGAYTLTINGNVTGGAGSMAGVQISGACNVIVNGCVSGAAGDYSYGLYHASDGIVTVNNVGATAVQGGGGAGQYGTADGVRADYCSVVVNGNVIGGTGSGTCQGVDIRNTGNGSLTVTGNVTGGTGQTSYGVMNSGSGTTTLNSCNMIDGTGSVACAGRTPVWNITGRANYHQHLGVNLDGAGVAAVKFVVAPAQTQVELGVVIYSGFNGTLDPNQGRVIGG